MMDDSTRKTTEPVHKKTGQNYSDRAKSRCGPPHDDLSQDSACCVSSEPKLFNVLRLPQVLAATGVAASTLYEMVAVGAFPAPIPLHKRAKGWVEEEVRAWQQTKIEQRNNEQ